MMRFREARRCFAISDFGRFHHGVGCHCRMQLKIPKPRKDQLSEVSVQMVFNYQNEGTQIGDRAMQVHKDRLWPGSARPVVIDIIIVIIIIINISISVIIMVAIIMKTRIQQCQIMLIVLVTASTTKYSTMAFVPLQENEIDRKAR